MKNPSWYPDSPNKDLIAEFILWFSRIEYALKSDAAFSKTHPHFQADWDKLKRALSSVPVPQELENALAYIQHQPPMKQIGANQWELIQEGNDWDLLIRALKTVRNNLFHGGKHHTGPVLQPARDQELLNHCLAVMKAISTLLPQHLQTIFSEVI
jgi:hypothetical protein